MPKIEMRTKQQIENDRIRAEILAAMNSKGIYRQNLLARKAGIPQSTMSVHLNDMDKMTMGELRRIAKVTGLTIRIERGRSDGD